MLIYIFERYNPLSIRYQTQIKSMVKVKNTDGLAMDIRLLVVQLPNFILGYVCKLLCLSQDLYNRTLCCNLGLNSASTCRYQCSVMCTLVTPLAKERAH